MKNKRKVSSSLLEQCFHPHPHSQAQSLTGRADGCIYGCENTYACAAYAPHCAHMSVSTPMEQGTAWHVRFAHVRIVLVRSFQPHAIHTHAAERERVHDTFI